MSHNIMIKYENYILVFFEKGDYIPSHPMDEYYLLMFDLSINLKINFKWLYWGFNFLDELRNEIIFLDKNLLDVNLKIIYNKEINHKILFKKSDLNQFDNFIEIQKIELENLVSKNIFLDEIIHLKMHLTLYEYLLITSVYTPALIKLQ